MNSSPNLTTPSRKPNAMTIRHGIRGRPTRKTAGSAMNVNRRALKSSGGKCSSPSWMTTKLTPQTAVTSTSRATERAGMATIVGPVTMQSQ